MRTRLLAPLAAMAALLLGSVANATTTHHTIHGAITAIMPYPSPDGTAVPIPAVFSEGTSCTMSFDYTSDGAVDVSASPYVGVFEHAFSNLRISFGANAYVGTANAATAQVINAEGDLTEDLFYITGPLVGANFPAIDGYNFTSGNDGFLYMIDGTKAAFSDNTLPANISNLFFTDSKPASTELHFIDANGNHFIVRAAFGAQEILAPITYLEIDRGFHDNVATNCFLAMGATVIDPSFAGPINSVTLAYPNGAAVGTTPFGWSFTIGSGSNSCGTYAGEAFLPNQEIPNGAYTIAVDGGLRNGLLLTYNVDRSLLPPRMPILLCTSEYALEHSRANRPITIFFTPFLEYRRSLQASIRVVVWKNEIVDGLQTRSEAFTAINLPPKTVFVTLPANTLSAGSFDIDIHYVQNGPVSASGLAVKYSTTQTHSFTRKR